MSSVDERVVQMRFENSQFKKGAQETQKALNDVNSAVDSAGKGGGLLSLSSNMQRVSLTASKMAVVTTTALATITNRAVNAGVNMAKSLTFDPIKAGMAEFESLLTKQNVIMNATGKSGKEVNLITEGEETELLQCAFYVILGKPGDDRAGFRIEDIGAVKFLGDALHALFQLGAAVLNIRDEIDFNGKGQVICGHVNKLLSKSIDFLYIGMLR